MRRLAKAGVLTILIAWAVTAEWSSLTCKPSHEPYGQNQSDHQKCTVPRAVFYDTAAPVLRLIRDIVHDFRDELLAIATVLIAFFTATLWRATDRLWKSAENQITEFRASVLQAKEAAASQATDMAAYIQQASRSASAAEVLANAAAASANAAELMAKVSISVELPALFVESAIIPLAYQENVEDWFYHLLPTISVRNYGRTPAIIREVNIVAHIGKLPETPYYPPAAYMRLTAITNGDPHEFKEYRYYTEAAFDKSLIASFEKNEEFFYIYGIIRYIDFMSVDHDRGFAFLWVPANKSFIPFYDKRYYYQT